MTAFHRLLGYARPYRGRFMAALLAMMVYAVASATLALLIKPLTDKILPQRVDAFFWGFPIDLKTWGIAVLVVYFFKGLGAYFSARVRQGDVTEIARRAALGRQVA